MKEKINKLEKLTEREKQVLNVIKNNMTIKPPTQECIGEYLGIKKQTINEHIGNLKKKGFLDESCYPIEMEKYKINLLYGKEIIFNETNFSDFNFKITG